MNYKLIKIQFSNDDELSHLFQHSQIFPLRSGKFLFIDTHYTSPRMLVLSNDFRTIKARQHFIYMDYVLEKKLFLQVASTTDGRIGVLWWDDGYNTARVFVLDEDLNMLSNDTLHYENHVIN